MGPSFNLRIRRTQLASADLAKAAMRKPKVTVAKKVKNVHRDALGEKVRECDCTSGLEDFDEL